jgi:hypothetical protein
MKTKIRIVVLVFVLSLILVGATLADNDFEMPRWVLGGGASESTSSSVTLNATLGQPFVGLASSGNISLEQGFWHGSGLLIYLPLVQK